MGIIFFSLYWLCKLVFHVTIADSYGDKTGEKNCVFCILNFGSFHLQLAGIHMCCKKESAKSRGLRGNVGYVGACVAWVCGCVGCVGQFLGCKGQNIFYVGQDFTLVISFTWIACQKHFCMGQFFLCGSKCVS